MLCGDESQAGRTWSQQPAHQQTLLPRKEVRGYGPSSAAQKGYRISYPDVNRALVNRKACCWASTAPLPWHWWDVVHHANRKTHTVAESAQLHHPMFP